MFVDVFFLASQLPASRPRCISCTCFASLCQASPWVGWRSYMIASDRVVPSFNINYIGDGLRYVDVQPVLGITDSYL